MADQTAILVFIGIACTVFAIVSAYLIYNHVREEKDTVYRARVRRKKDQMGPSDYLENPGTKRRKQNPVIVPPQMPKEDEPFVPDPVPEPDPVVEPIVADELPPQPAKADDVDPVPVPAVLPAVAVAGAAAAVALNASNVPPPPPPKEKSPEPKKEKFSKKPKEDTPKEDDFDDYRNFSPKSLPPPKYEPPTNPARIDPEPSESVPLRSLDRVSRSNVDRGGLQF